MRAGRAEGVGDGTGRAAFNRRGASPEHQARIGIGPATAIGFNKNNKSSERKPLVFALVLKREARV